MNLNQLEVFHAVGREESVTRAATRLGISQPAVSKAVSELEKSLAVRLFDRGPRGMALTQQGRLLLNYAEKIFDLEREADEAMRQSLGLESGRLEIGASSTVGNYLFPSALARFHELYPGVEVLLRVENTFELQQTLLQHQIEAAFTEGLIDQRDFVVSSFMQDHLVFIVGPNHPLAGHGSLTARQVMQHPLILREPHCGTRIQMEAMFVDRGFHPNVSMELGNTEAIKRAVALDLGVGLISSLAVVDEVNAGRLKVLEVPDLALTRPLNEIRISWKHPSRCLTAFHEVLKDTLGSTDKAALRHLDRLGN